MPTGHEPTTTTAAVEKAIRLAQEAVQLDEAGDLDEAIRKYQESIELIKLGLQVQHEDEMVDNTVLHKYSKLYSDRIQEIRRSMVPYDTPARLVSASAAGDVSGSAAAFTFDDTDVKTAKPPPPPPVGVNEWQRPFWLMRILLTSITQGGFLTTDGSVFVPRRVWLQRGARFTAMAAKVDCAQCLTTEFDRLCEGDYRRPAVLLKELEKLSDTLDALQARSPSPEHACSPHARLPTGALPSNCAHASYQSAGRPIGRIRWRGCCPLSPNLGMATLASRVMRWASWLSGSKGWLRHSIRRLPGLVPCLPNVTIRLNTWQR